MAPNRAQGLVDARDAKDFDRRLVGLKRKWDEIEISAHPTRDPFFHAWFLSNKAEVMKTTMIASVRTKAGLGSPPGRYTTNRNESINNVVQAFSDYGKSTWVDLNNKLYQLVVGQLKEVERCIFHMGEYKFKPSYRHLEIDSSQWFLMTVEQRKKHVRKVFSAQSIPFESGDEHVSLEPGASSSGATSSGQSSASTTRLSVKVEKSGITTIPAELLLSMWKKAERLLSTPNSICAAPGMANARCVASDTGEKPHIVTQNTRGATICDDSCIGWKSQKICAHVLAVAESKGHLEDFLQQYRAKKTQPNYTAVVSHGIAKSVGSKPGSKAKRKGPTGKQRPEVEVRVDPDPDGSSVLPAISAQSPPLSGVQVIQHSISNVSSPVTVQCLPPVTSSFHPQPIYSSGEPAVASAGPFTVKFLTGYIKICAGCRKGYLRTADGKSLPPPLDLILVRQEQHIYYNVVNARQQLSSAMNVHYHANLACPRLRSPQFNPKDLKIPDDVRTKLLPEHRSFLFRTFGVH